MSRITFLPCIDSPALGEQRRQELWIDRNRAMELGTSAVRIVEQGYYINQKQERVDIAPAVQNAVKRKVSIPPDMELPTSDIHIDEMTIQVCNETTMQAARRLARHGNPVLALNFANGLHPGGGFLHGARAQEETLCRSSALFATLLGDPMYAAHARRSAPDSTDWAILSPDVPVFRTDDGQLLEAPYLTSFITCAAPFAPTVGLQESTRLMKQRIYRVLDIARSYGYTALVLGAWGCGAFGNDPHAIAGFFKEALTGTFAESFSDVVFAITDWSEDRHMLGPFRDAMKNS